MPFIPHNMTTTQFELHGFEVVQTLGMVRRIIVRSRSIFGTIGASLQTLVGGNITLLTNLCERTRQEALDLMLQHAGQLGADAVVGVRYDATEIMQGVTEVLAYGTAVVVQPRRGQAANPACAAHRQNKTLDPALTRTIINPTEVFFRRRISLVTQPTAAPPVRVEIYDQVYNLRGVDAEDIMKLAQFVDGKMRTVGEQTSTIDSLRLAVLAALNIADEYHILKKKYDLLAGEFNRRAGQLAGALDEVLKDERRAG